MRQQQSALWRFLQWDRCRLPLGLMFLWCLVAAIPAHGQVGSFSHLKHGDPAPALHAVTIEGESIDTTAELGHAVLLVFGETEQPRSEQAFLEIARVLKEEALPRDQVHWFVVLSKHSDPDALDPTVQDASNKPSIVHDTEREAFATYGVIALPSVVLIDSEGKVVHAMASLHPRFADVLREGLMLARGQITQDQFERDLVNPPSEYGAEDEAKARRLTRLGRYLYAQGMNDLAEAKYTEALAAKPDYFPARLALGELLLRTDRHADAEAIFRAARLAHPNSIKASLGLAEAWILLDGEDVENAEAMLQDILRRDGAPARAHYLLGVIHAARGEVEQASELFRQASEKLLREVELARAMKEGTEIE